MIDANAAEAIFLAALEKATPRERASYVEEACAASPKLLERVQELLAAHEQADGPLDMPLLGLGATMRRAEAIDGPGTVIGPYS
jgi:eukaryotic-like serine/threonine-protein kinase